MTLTLWEQARLRGPARLLTLVRVYRPGKTRPKGQENSGSGRSVYRRLWSPVPGPAQVLFVRHLPRSLLQFHSTDALRAHGLGPGPRGLSLPTSRMPAGPLSAILLVPRGRSHIPPSPVFWARTGSHSSASPEVRCGHVPTLASELRQKVSLVSRSLSEPPV